jgi:flagellin-specific chaperone FliS
VKGNLVQTAERAPELQRKAKVGKSDQAAHEGKMIKLCNTAIKMLQFSRQKLLDNEVEECYFPLVKAQEIFESMHSQVESNASEEIAGMISRVIELVSDSIIRHSIGSVEGALRVATTLRDSCKAPSRK